MILKEQLREKIKSRTMINPPRAPLGLHCFTKATVGEHWYAVGPVDWGRDAGVYFELRLKDDREFFHVNRLLREICEEMGFAFINMA